MAKRSVDIADLPDLAGQELGHSPWLEIDQERIDRFAKATDDDQWIHCDVERANDEMGGTIAHGYLTLAMLPALSEQILNVSGVTRILNYGLNKLRFISPVASGSRIRLSQKVLEVGSKGNGYQVTVENVFELEESERPACIAETLMVYYP